MLQQHIGFSTETEHLATVLVDRYTWRRLIDPNHYDLLGMVAISIAAKITCRRRKVTFSKLCNLSMNKYKCSDMAEMEMKIIHVLGYDLVSPIPHTFLGFAIASSLEVLKELGENEYFLLARYIFELGLTEMALSQCSASLKCAAAIYLIRHLLRLQGKRSVRKQHLLNLPLWTNKLTSTTGHKESKALRHTAYIYGLMLIEAQFFLNDIAPPGKMTGCATKYKAAFYKYIHENSAYIAMHPLVNEFTTSDIECFLY
nr:cyclin A3 4 [Hymenolepis microstoma]